MNAVRNRLRKATPTKIIIMGYFFIILFGALLLMLPISTRTGEVTPFLDALFTSTSATCVTGLVVQDTYAYWSLFGQWVILGLIQIGGLGFITMMVIVSIFTRRKIGLKQRVMMQESISAHQTGGIIRLTQLVFRTTLLLEGGGFLLLALRFCPMMGFWRGLYFALFHSVSAFCNAGFDLMGIRQPMSSMTTVSGDVLINVVLMCLIVLGGLGFFVWGDLKHHKLQIRKYALQTKVVLVTTALLIVIPFLLFLCLEWNGSAMVNQGGGERVLSSLFQSVTPRTAGFNTLDLASMQGASLLIMIVLMLIGGSPGSTAGGMKTTAVAVLAFSIRSTFRRHSDIQCFRRRLDHKVLRNVSTIVSLYLILFLVASISISAIDRVDILSAMFESASAIGTVGLTLGITPSLSALSQIILIFLMYFGRVGCLTMLYAMTDNQGSTPSKFPMDTIVVG